MKIVVANNKGGQGKTFFARFILWFLAQNPANAEKIAYLDNNLDQLNLADAMRNTNIKRYFSLDEIPDNVVCVIDTGPDLVAASEIIRQADILIVPIVLGKDAFKGTMRVRDIRGKNDLRVVINDWDESQNETEVEEQLAVEKINVIGKLPKYKRIAYNLDHDLAWYYGLTQPIIDYTYNLVKNLLSAQTVDRGEYAA